MILSSMEVSNTSQRMLWVLMGKKKEQVEVDVVYIAFRTDK